MRGAVERFEPGMDGAVREARLAGWKRAVESVVGLAGA